MSNPSEVQPNRAMNPHAFESWSEKFNRKVSENPWVPLGCLATCGALVMSAVKMRQGKSQSMNYWMRARVGLQGVTLVALVVGAMKLTQEKEAAAAVTLPAESALKDKLEFEQRLRDAEQAHSEETGIAAMALANARQSGTISQKTAAEGIAKLDKEAVPAAAAPGKSWWKLW